MSGTPPLPSKPTHESGGRARDPYQTTPDQDIYRGYAATHGDFRDPHGHPHPIRRYGQAAEGPRQDFARTDESIALSRPYPVQHGEAMVPQHSYLPLPAPLPVQPNYPIASQPPAPENPTFSSPKSQRKTKGHVASACVPCKRAHLRCDAQRPCSRCLSNGKEDACVDVQHKKRGRPRLREDRDLRYDIPGRLGYPQETSARRPLSLYASNPVAPTFEDSLRRTQSYRVLKSQPADPVVPRFIERGSASDANIIPAPLTISTRIPEPAAFLTMDFQIAKLSETFADAVGIQNARGLRLVDLVAPSDRDRLHGHHRQMQQEQARRDPHYLPPIFGRQEEDRVIQSLGFSPEEMSKYSLDKHEFVTFISQDGQPRNFAMRLGLAKQESVYFVVVHLNTGVRSLGHPTPSPNPRDVRESPFAYQQPYQQPFSQPTPVSATFEPRRQRLGDTAYVGSRQTGPPSQGAPGQSPGLPSSYAASPSRPDYPAGSSPYQIPRSELGTSHMGVQSSGYRLPPILAPQQASQAPNEPPTWPHQRDDKSRVDIGGLIERPNPPGRQH